MKTPPFLVVLCLFFTLVSCEYREKFAFLYETDADIMALVQNNNPSYPDMEFMVMADPHYFAPELGTSGSPSTGAR